MRRVDLSSLILTGQMTREDALLKLKTTAYDNDLIQEDFDYVAAKLNISNEQLREYHSMPKKFFWDYKNQRRIFKLGEMILSSVNGTRRGGSF